ncbi:uncharacterized protein LOC118513245 [Anopheles stephensi]|uniref:uncharacterized protein LOC118513245 n=1 Tax=Anopheles stephensi TaxID=30069 RepID=UPI0016588A57|nr:uncharacterized protein LOC118513245 [Anopheles stephensi]
MFRALTVIPCALVILLVIFEQVSCHGRHHHGRHGHHHHHHRRDHPHHPPMSLSMAIYDPKGIELSTRRPNSTAQYFAVEMFVNNPNGTTPDVSHNTSEVVYGKYIVRDTEAIIRPGDVLNITAYMGFSDGAVLKHTTKFYVFRSMIRNNCTCGSATTPRESPPIQTIPPWARTTTTTVSPSQSTSRTSYTRRPTAPRTTTSTPTMPTSSENQDLSTGGYSDELDCEIDPTTNLCFDNSFIDVRTFSDRVRGQPEKLVQTDPSRGPKVRTNYLIMEPYPRLPEHFRNDPSIDLTAYVRRFLTDVLNLKQLADTNLVSGRPAGNAIVFEMDTLIDKLQVLYHAKQKGLTTVQDYDALH